MGHFLIFFCIFFMFTNIGLPDIERRKRKRNLLISSISKRLKYKEHMHKKMYTFDHNFRDVIFLYNELCIIRTASTNLLIIDRNSDGARPLCRPTPVSVLTGSGRLVERAPPAPSEMWQGRFQAKNTPNSLANVKFSDFRAIHKFGRRPLDMWRRH